MKGAYFAIGLLSGICLVLIGVIVTGQHRPPMPVNAQAMNGDSLLVGTAGEGTQSNDIIYVVQKDAEGGTHLAVYQIENQTLDVRAFREITWDLQVPEYQTGRDMKVRDVKKEIEKLKKDEEKKKK